VVSKLFVKALGVFLSLQLLSVSITPVAMTRAYAETMSKGEGNIQEAILPNGLKVLILEEHSFPVFSSMVFYRVGSRNENLGESGLSHLVEHLLFDRVGKYRKGEIGAIIARNGGMFNGFTSDDFTVYFETMAPTKLDLALKIEADRMRLANFSQEEVAAEIKRIEKELELEAKDQANLLVKEVRSAAFQRHPYKNPTIGWSTDVQKLTLDDVKRHYKEYYQPGNATLVIVGDIDATAALASVRKHFAGIAAGELPRPLRVVEPAQRAEKRVYLKYGGAADVLSLAYHAPAFTDNDAVALAVLEKIMISGVGGRLKSQLVDAKICTQARATYEVKKDPGLFVVNLNAQPGVGATRTLESFDQLVEQLKNAPVADSELRRARNHTELQLLSERDGPYHNAFQLGFFDCLENWQSAYTWFVKLRTVSASDVQRVARKYLTSESRVVGILSGTGKSAPSKGSAVKDSGSSNKAKGDKPSDDKDSKSKFDDKKTESSKSSGDKGKDDNKNKSDKSKSDKSKNDKSKNDKSKSDKSKSNDKQKGTKHPRHTAWQTKPLQLAQGANQTPFGGINLSAYKDSSLTVPGAKHDSRLLLSQVDGAVAAPAEVAQPTGSTTSAARRNVIKKTTLKNGVTVAVLETKVSPSVQIVGAIKAGDAYEPVGKRGVAMLLNRLIGDGSTRYSKSQMTAMQDDLGIVPGAMIKFESGPQWLSFQARCLSKDTGTILNLLGNQIKAPLFTDSEFEQSKQSVIDRIKHSEDTVRAKVDRALVQGLIAPNTSFYPLEPVDKARFIGNLKLIDVKDFHQKAVRPDACTIVFIGDISLEQATSLCEHAFDGWTGQSTAKKVTVQPNPRRLLKNSIIIEKRQDSMVTLGKLVDTSLGAPDYALLLLSDCALTSHPIFSRFAQKISGETTLQSSLSLEDLSSDVESMPGANLWSIDIPVVTNAMPQVVQSIQNELRKFSRQGLTPSEYSEMRLYMNGALPVRWMSNSQLAARSILESLVLEGRDDPLPGLYAGIKSSTLESLNKFVRETFKPDRASLVIAGTKQSIGQVHGLKKDESAPQN